MAIPSEKTIVPLVTVIGLASLDVTWNPAGESKMRLGGVAHACRALWALDIPYNIFFLAPTYLHDAAADYFRSHGAQGVTLLGTISGAPAVMLIGSPKETAHQKYELLMRDTMKTTLCSNALDKLGKEAANQNLVLAAEFDFEPILDSIRRDPRRRVHIDIANASNGAPSIPVATIITSTSSPYFKERRTNTPLAFAQNLLPSCAEAVIVKENRGGSRIFWDHQSQSIGAQLRSIVHSVGVGDCYDAVFVALEQRWGFLAAASYASWAAAEYAATTEPDVFKKNITWLMRISPEELPLGTSVPWEKRPDFHVYIAAPDFDYLDCSLIGEVEEALKYHNFSPHRPIQENGQVTVHTPRAERLRIHLSDLELLSRCSCVVAVDIGSDPGTYVEVGRATERGIPVIVLDPQGQTNNLMLVESANAVVHDLDNLLVEIFQAAARAQVAS